MFGNKKRDARITELERKVSQLEEWAKSRIAQEAQQKAESSGPLISQEDETGEVWLLKEPHAQKPLNMGVVGKPKITVIPQVDLISTKVIP